MCQIIKRINEFKMYVNERIVKERYDGSVYKSKKERFCKDRNIPIRIFQEPYFTDRLTLYDKFYGTLKSGISFKRTIQI